MTLKMPFPTVQIFLLGANHGGKYNLTPPPPPPKGKVLAMALNTFVASYAMKDSEIFFVIRKFLLDTTPTIHASYGPACTPFRP